MKFCTSCGNAVILKVPAGDDRERFVCSSCEFIHYSNPHIIVGCVPVFEGKVLLCKRAIEPRKGFWTLPAGFMENGETTLQGATRETWEEAKARVTNVDLYRIFDVPYISQVYMFYRCDLDDIPWDNIAFQVVSETLKEYFSDAAAGHFPVRVSAIDHRAKRS